MEIKFKDTRLQRLISSEKELTKKYGLALAKQTQTRMLHLEAARNLEELLKMAGTWEPLKGGRKNQFSTHLPNGNRLIVTPDNPKFKEDGGLDLSQITSIIVVEIIDYHK